MNLIEEDSIKCTSCEGILKTPVILPCGHAVCKRHENEVTEINMSRKLKCGICKKLYDIPDNGFVRARALEFLLEKKIEDIDLGEEYSSARDKCRSFGDLLDQFNRIKNDPEMRVHTVLSELRNQIDLRREELKIGIDREALRLIEKLDDYKKRCQSKLDFIESDSKLNEKIERWENALDQLQQSLGVFEKNREKLKSISNEATSNLNELQMEFLNLNDNLLLNRINDLKCSDFLVPNNFIHEINLDIKKLSSFRYATERKQISFYKTKAVGFDWRLWVYIDQDDDIKTNKKENYVEVYFDPRQNTLNRKLKVEYDVVLVDQLGMDKSLIISKLEIFNLNLSTGSGISKIIKLKELLSNYNLYNAQNDSCTIQAIIKKIEWL